MVGKKEAQMQILNTIFMMGKRDAFHVSLHHVVTSDDGYHLKDESAYAKQDAPT